MADWYYEPYNPNGGFNAAAGRRLLEGTEMRLPETLARESLQNACDAQASASRPVRVEYRLLDGEPHETPDVSSLLNLETASGPATRHLIDVPADPGLLYIEDFNTTGLGGTDRADVPSRPEDNFVRLCRNIGDTQDIQGRGGTFGFGKAVYWSNSAIHLVAFYSRFRPGERSDGARSRFIAVGWFRDHDHEGRRYTGRSWFGRIANEKSGPTVYPLIDDRADEMAARLGFRARPDDEHTGTSVLVVAAEDIDHGFLVQIREAVETHYWPRLLEDRLDVKIFLGDELLDDPAPRSRFDLRPYLAAFERANAGPAVDDKRVHVEDLRYSPRGASSGEYALGRVAVVMQDRSSSPPPEEAETTGVALMRAPRMVVQYYSTRGFPELPYGGVFIASEDIEDILRRSEPPAHDRWSQSSNELSKVERRVVNNTLAKVRSSVTGFLEQFVEDEPRSADHCEQVSRELAKFLSVRGSGRGPDPTERLVSVQFLRQPDRISSSTGNQRLRATLQVRTDRSDLKKFRKQRKAAAKALRVDLALQPVIELGSRLPRARIPTAVFRDQDGEGRPVDGGLLFPVSDDGASYHIDVVSEPLPFPDLTVDLTVNARLLSEEELENGA